VAATIELLIRKLGRLGPLSSDDLRVLENLPIEIRQVEAEQDLMMEGQRPPYCLVLLDGMVCRYKTLKDGQRQIMSFHFPGDILNLATLLLGKLDHNISALSAVKVAPIAHTTLLDWTERHPRLGRLLWHDTLIDAAIFREWVVNVGRRPAYARIAHLLCELVTRLREASLGDGHTCDLPITQVELADATGLSTVHINRALQEFRANGLIDLRGRTLVTLNWEGLKRAGGFDPAYLHQLAVSAAA
jgi:CRP-like cAMP-binding protein